VRVIDASVLCDFLLEDPQAVAAVLDGQADESDPLHVPSFAEIEVINALRGLERGKHLQPGRADLAVRDLERTRLVLHSCGSLRERIWELRHNLTAYDATYVALAERQDSGVLVTRDRGLAKSARATLGEARVQLF
jgi:predicted nucleic acid-binding protein